MFDVCIIGKGPAGISAALYILRAGFKVVIIGKDFGALEKAAAIDNYYGVASLSGRQLAEIGVDQVKKLGACIIEDEVVSISYNNDFEIISTNNKVLCKALLLATGSSRKVSAIKNLNRYEGSGVSYCAVCDGFFYRGKNVAVLGNGSYAMSECEHLLSFANSVTVLTDGQKPNAQLPNGVKAITGKIKSIEGKDRLTGVEFEDGTKKQLDGIFVAIGCASSVDFARKLGVITHNNKIQVEKDFSTNIPGLFAAGDCVSEVMQVSVAVGQGAVAGLSIIKYLRR